MTALALDTCPLWPLRVSGAQYIRVRRAIDATPAAVAAALTARYVATAGPVRRFYSAGGRVLDSWNDADAELMGTAAKLAAARLPLAFSEAAIDERAHVAAELCALLPSAAAAIRYAEANGITLPKLDRRIHRTQATLWARLKSPRFWRRRLRALLARSAENVLRELGFVHAHASAYVTADGRERHRQHKAATARFLAASEALCVQTGELFPLADIAARTVSNPAIRRGELMVRARGFEETARAHGHVAMFVTLTCPSAFHAWKRDGERNPLWNGATAREGQKWLNRQWAKARAKLARLSVPLYGIRVAEPHHDATPHWHLLLFVVPAHAGTVRAVLSGVWLSEYADEAGAREHRARFESIDPGKGSAAGYLAKYVSKNIDGAGAIASAESDEAAGRPVSESVGAVEAWARVHGIRQFQQIGGPSVTLWRELRRIREPVDVEPIEAARAATDKTDAGGPSWSRFIDALGGLEACRETSRAMLDKSPPMKTDPAGRRVLRVTEWGELPTDRVSGVKCIVMGRFRRITTRVLEWVRVLRVSVLSALGPVAITVRGEIAAGSVAPWGMMKGPSRAGP